MYPGISAPAQEQIIPLIFRNFLGWNTTFYIQNAESSPQNISLEVYISGSGTAVAPIPTFNVQGNSFVRVSMTDNIAALNAFGSNFGYAKIKAEAGKKTAVVAESIKESGNLRFEAWFAGRVDADTGSELDVPLVFNKLTATPWTTGINIINARNTTENVTVTYNPSGKASVSKRFTVGPFASTAIVLNNPALPGGAFPLNTFGTLKVKADDNNAKLHVAVNNSRVKTGLGSILPGLIFANATNRVAFPIALQQGSGYVTNINVYSNVSSGNVTVLYVRSNVDPNIAGNSISRVLPLSNGQLTLVAKAANVGLPNGFNGSVYIIGPAGSKIIAYSNTSTPTPGQHTTADMAGINY
jgi:hypothetical protein